MEKNKRVAFEDGTIRCPDCEETIKPKMLLIDDKFMWTCPECGVLHETEWYLYGEDKENIRYLKMKVRNALILEEAEYMGWGVTTYEDGEIEFRQPSPAGEDFGFSIYGEDYLEELQEYAFEFQPCEHAEMWIVARKNVSGVPDIKTLVKDADDIKNMLLDLFFTTKRICLEKDLLYI